MFIVDCRQWGGGQYFRRKISEWMKARRASSGVERLTASPSSAVAAVAGGAGCAAGRAACGWGRADAGFGRAGGAGLFWKSAAAFSEKLRGFSPEAAGLFPAGAASACGRCGAAAGGTGRFASSPPMGTGGKWGTGGISLSCCSLIPLRRRTRRTATMMSTGRSCSIRVRAFWERRSTSGFKGREFRKTDKVDARFFVSLCPLGGKAYCLLPPHPRK